MGEVVTLPRPLRVVEQSPAGTHEFPAPDRPRVDVSAYLDGYRVWLFGKRYRDFNTLTSAARCAAALTTLDALDALPGNHEEGVA